MARREVARVLRAHGCRRHARTGIGRLSEAGAAAVEFALVLPLLAMLLLGVVTMGLAYGDHVALSNAVREGSRFGAAAPNTGSWGSSVVTDTVGSYANTDNPLTSSDVCALLIKQTTVSGTPSYTILKSSNSGCATGSTAAGTVPSSPTGIPDGCFIKVWAQRPAKLNWIFKSTTVTLRDNSVALYDRTQLCS